MDTINGFEVFEDFLPGIYDKKTTTEPGKDVTDDKIDMEGLSEELTDEELEQLKKSNKNDKNDKDDKKDDKDKKTNDEPKRDDDTNDGNQTNDDVQNDDNTVSAFFEVLSEKMGWDLTDEDEVPQTPEELVEYFQQVIEDNSVPQYASEEVEALDNFVRNGGNIRDYLQIDAEIDLENIDITEDEGNQKLVLREFLKEKGYNSKQIDKKLTKYEDAGLLEDEAEDALEALKEIREDKKQQLLKNQEKQAKERMARQQQYFNSVVNEIKGMDSIRGVKIPEKEKRVLIEYIFKPDADGQTQFHKDWSKSVKNLIETAYFTKYGDQLMKAAKTEGSNAAIDKFKNSLNRTGISRRTKTQDNTSDLSMWDSFARQLRVN